MGNPSRFSYFSLLQRSLKKATDFSDFARCLELDIVVPQLCCEELLLEKLLGVFPGLDLSSLPNFGVEKLLQALSLDSGVS